MVCKYLKISYYLIIYVFHNLCWRFDKGERKE